MQGEVLSGTYVDDAVSSIISSVFILFNEAPAEKRYRMAGGSSRRRDGIRLITGVSQAARRGFVLTVQVQVKLRLG